MSGRPVCSLVSVFLLWKILRKCPPTGKKKEGGGVSEMIFIFWRGIYFPFGDASHDKSPSPGETSGGGRWKIVKFIIRKFSPTGKKEGGVDKMVFIVWRGTFWGALENDYPKNLPDGEESRDCLSGVVGLDTYMFSRTFPGRTHIVRLLFWHPLFGTYSSRGTLFPRTTGMYVSLELS